MPITLTDDTAQAILMHLKTGGTRLEADLLAARVIHEAQEPKREADTQRRIDEAVEAATTPAESDAAEVESPIVTGNGRASKARHSATNSTVG